MFKLEFYRRVSNWCFIGITRPNDWGGLNGIKSSKKHPQGQAPVQQERLMGKEITNSTLTFQSLSEVKLHLV